MPQPSLSQPMKSPHGKHGLARVLDGLDLHNFEGTYKDLIQPYLTS